MQIVTANAPHEQCQVVCRAQAGRPVLASEATVGPGMPLHIHPRPGFATISCIMSFAEVAAQAQRHDAY